MLRVPTPIIAAINGAVAGVGPSIALIATSAKWRTTPI
jgi:enoyl-CoA hydratase/carnithine racemase